MYRFFVLTVSLCAAAIPGCATSVSGNNRQPVNVNVNDGAGRPLSLQYFTDISTVVDSVPGTPEQVWGRLGSVYPELGIPVTLVDTSAHVLGAIRASLMGYLGKQPLAHALQCGTTPIGAPRANAYRVSLSVVTQVAPTANPNESLIRTAVSAEARDENGSSNTVQCGSTGALENEIAAALRHP